MALKLAPCISTKSQLTGCTLKLLSKVPELEVPKHSHERVQNREAVAQGRGKIQDAHIMYIKQKTNFRSNTNFEQNFCLKPKLRTKI